MLNEKEMGWLKQIAVGLAHHFGSNCEIVVHEISSHSAYSSIVAIENGHVTGRKVGDGPSHVVLEQLYKSAEDTKDHYAYLTKTKDGRTLKSTTLFIKDDSGKISAIFSINYDVSAFKCVNDVICEFTSIASSEESEPEEIPLNVSQLLDHLINRADKLVGKPVALMNKEDKMKAIRYLNDTGALLITKSGEKIAKHFDISKFTMYSYLNNKLDEGVKKDDQD